jgi:predicted lipoprotein
MSTALTVLLVSIGVLAGCSSEDPVTPPAATDLQPALSHATNSVIIPIYSDLDTQAGMLVTAITELQANPTQTELDEARAAWRATRIPWENSEAFLFGPVDTEGIDPSIDSWPVNEVDLNAVLSGSDVLTQAFIDGLEGTLKGFHTIEYLLFGLNGNKLPSELTTREFEYLVACSQSLKGQTARLVAAWSTTGDDFGANIVNAGETGSIYISQKAALQELANGMLTIADEVANGKINDPFVQMDVTLEESRFSNNSKADFQDNIRGIGFMYEGDYRANGDNMSTLIRSIDADLDSRFVAAVDNAVTMIGAIPGTFTTAIFDNRPAVEEAQRAVRAVQQILEEEILPLIANQIQ